MFLYLIHFRTPESFSSVWCNYNVAVSFLGTGHSRDHLSTAVGI